MIQQLVDFFETARVLFVKEGCPKCAILKKFIERFNFEVPPEKRIHVIDVTMYDEYNGYAHPFLKLFDKHDLIGRNLPVLFFDGNRIPEAHTREEAEAFLLSALRKDFKIEKYNPYIFNKQCSYVNKGLFGKKTLVCDDNGG